jgi:hypothetical protein
VVEPDLGEQGETDAKRDKTAHDFHEFVIAFRDFERHD